MIKIIIKLSKIKLSLMVRQARVSGIMIILVILLDLHKFGAWYTGNETKYRQPYGLSLILVGGVPFIIYCSAAIVQIAVKLKLYSVLYLSPVFFFTLPFTLCREDSSRRILKYSAVNWIDQGRDTFYWMMPVDSQFFIGVFIAVAKSIGICTIIWIVAILPGQINHNPHKQ